MRTLVLILGAWLSMAVLLVPAADAAEPGDLQMVVEDSTYMHREGEPGRFDIRVHNLASVEATNVKVELEFPRGVTFVQVSNPQWGPVTCTATRQEVEEEGIVLTGARCEIERIEPKYHQRATLEVVADATTPTEGMQRIWGSAWSHTADPMPNNNVDSGILFVSPSSADLGFIKVTVPNTAKTGEYVTVKATVRNAGPEDVTDVTVNVQASGSVDLEGTPQLEAIGGIQSLPAGHSGTVAFIARVHKDATAGPVDFRLRLANRLYDPVKNNNTAESRTQITLTNADTALELTGPASASPGDEVVYQGTWRNNGPDRAYEPDVDIPIDPRLQDVTVTDTYRQCDFNPYGKPPKVYCRRSYLDAAEVHTFTIRARVAADAAPGVLDITGTVAPDAHDPVPDNNTTRMRTTIN
ncbi:CARDB domain-containing protein [Actinomadura hibisca]|uniref:CARDB domain-containing protein n=1 Tax=Actinomadura hibisca TaxID=68565 RepID=UPI0008304AE7|nr:CARDB domain-containing protein [Actinomadura hibisca]